MTTLKAPLPDHLAWLTERAEGLLRPGAFLVPEEGHTAPQGSTLLAGSPDVPLGAPWAALAQAGHWDQSPYDGESFWLQLNLGDIPAAVRQPHWPVDGVVWLTLDLSDTWRAHTYFDPRPAARISWHPRVGRYRPQGVRFELQDTMSFATDETFPEIASDWREGGLAHDFDEWVQRHYMCRRLSDAQVGGWMHPIQGDCDRLRHTLVCAIERQDFGDSGAVYLHYSAEKSFFAHVETC